MNSVSALNPVTDVILQCSVGCLMNACI